jgi:hypothetical protein
MLTIIDHLPEGFLDTSAHDLHRVLSGPTLIHLPGRQEPPLFVSALLHGNEDVGLQAVQRLLKQYEGRELPRALSILIGNVSAAKEGIRHLPGQPDYNRVWPGTVEPGRPEALAMAQVVDVMRQRGVFASVDLHNNTGLNPHYACVNRLDNHTLQLAALFSRTVVYFVRPKGVQSMAFAEFCPSVTLECGKAGDEAGVAHAHEYVEACLRLSSLPDHPVAPHDIDLCHTVATVKLPPEVQFAFGGESAGLDLLFAEDLDHVNFRELPAGTPLARRLTQRGRIEVLDEDGRDIAHQALVEVGGELRLARSYIPAMLTLDTQVVRQDCLCYLMERYPLPA